MVSSWVSVNHHLEIYTLSEEATLSKMEPWP